MAALAAVDEEEAMAIEVDDDEVPTQGERQRNIHNKELYDQFTDEDGQSGLPTLHVPTWMPMTLCSRNFTRFIPSFTGFSVLTIHVYTRTS